MFEIFESRLQQMGVSLRSPLSGGRGRVLGRVRGIRLALTSSLVIASAGCGGVQGVVGADGVETRVTESSVDGKPRRIERWQGGKLLEDRHLFRDGKTQHSARPTKDPLVQDVVIFYEDGKTPHLRYQLRSGQMEGVVEEWNEQGALIARRQYQNGRPHGTEERFDGQGHRIATSVWTVGERNGPARTYFPSGKLESETDWRRGVPGASGKSYWETGKLRSTFSLESGVKHGEEVLYADRDGKVRVARQAWKMGVLHGLAETFYESGELATRVPFVNGLAEGPEEHFYKDGKPKFRVQRVADMRQGTAESFDEEGRKRAEVPYVNDVVEGTEKRFHPGGELAGTYPWVRGKIQGKATLTYPDGTVLATLPFVDGEVNGEEVRYRPNGKLVVRVPRKMGLAQGYVRFYDEEGRLDRYVQFVDDEPHGKLIAVYPQDPELKTKPVVLAEAYFEHGKPTGTLRRWNRQGKLVEQRPHSPDGSGMLTRWHDNGTKHLEVELRNGKEEGHEQIWAEAGWLWADRMWAAGTLVGEEKRFYKSGKLLGEYPIDDGQWHGMAKIYAERGGYLWSELPYVEGKEHGVETRYTRDHRKFALVTWEHGKMISTRYLRKRGRRAPVESDTWVYEGTDIKRRELVDIGQADSKLERRYYRSGAIELEVPRNQNGWNGEAIFYAEDGRIVARVPFLDGKRQGKEIRFFATGEKRMEIPYVEDEARGEVVSFYRNGTVASRFPAGDAAANGVEVQYHENGQVRMTVQLVGGKRHGVARLQGPDGADVVRTTYLHGEARGAEVSYHGNGRAQMVVPLIKGSREGEAIAYDRAGRRWAHVPWKAGKRDGTERRFGPDGNEVIEETTYRAGEPVETKTFTSDGSPGTSTNHQPPAAPTATPGAQ